MKRVLALIIFTFFILFAVFVLPHVLPHEGGETQKNVSDQASKTNQDKIIQFLYFRVYHLIEGKPIESYRYGQKDIFPFMKKFDLVDNKLIVYSNVNGCKALVGTLGLLCCLNESKRWCNFSFGVESLYGTSYGVSKFLPAENYSLNLSFALSGERILLFHANRSYPLKFGNQTLPLSDSSAWVFSDDGLRVMKVKPYVEIEYLKVELDYKEI